MLGRIANSVVTKIIIFGICIAMIAAAGRYFFFTQFLRADLEKVVSTQQEAIANYVAHDIDDKIIARQHFLLQLAKSLPLGYLDHPEKMRSWLKERHELQPLFSLGLCVIDRKGKAIVDFPVQQHRAGTDYSDRDFVQEALAGQFSIGRPVIGRVTSQAILPMGAPVRDASGRVVAVLAGVTGLGDPSFMDLIARGHIGATGGLLLISPRDGLVVYASDPALILKETAKPGSNAKHQPVLAAYQAGGVAINEQGVEEISSIAKVNSTGWILVARMPTAEAFATIKRSQEFIVGNLPVTIGIFLILAVFGMYYVFRPLFLAASFADRMTLGEIPLAPLPVARQDEVGHLTESFNRLLEKLLDSQSQLQKIAHHDALTGLPNRYLLSDRMAQILARAARNNSRIGVLFLDLDGFKPINDTLGHEAGDQALVQVAKRLKSVVREADTLARVGGDEFVVVMVDLDSNHTLAAAAATAVARKCLDVISNPLPLDGKECVIGVSIGIAIGQGCDSFDALLSAADEAMYRAKDLGRGCFVLAES